MKITYLIYLLIAVHIQVRCASQCQVGQYRDSNSCKPCYDNCISCSDGYTCNLCKPGYYGTQCDSPCSKGCQGGVCDKVTGSCTCLEGYTGYKCDSCQVGYYRDYNNCYRCFDTCKSCTGWYTCDACKAGYYGTYCYWFCPEGCLGRPCNKDTGACTCPSGFNESNCNTCLVGYYGDDCRPCSHGCQDVCDRRNGICSCKVTHIGQLCDKCVDGRYGQNCTNVCRQNCKSCTNGSTCVECMDGYRDNDCSQNCSEGCVDKLCRQSDAVCTGGCKQGYFGEHCCLPGTFGRSCEQQCHTNCFTCISKTECQSCKESFYGFLCNQKCPAMCKTCTSPLNCTACDNGYTGLTCQIQCPTNCLNCSNDGKCKTCKDGFSRPDTNCQCLDTLCTSPECTSCANSTYYLDGSTCCPCNSNCKHGTCTSADQCTYGCEDGLFGPKCKFQCTQIDMNCSVCSGDTFESSVCKSCTKGYYPSTNRTCAKCSTYCAEGPCNSYNGYCEKGCKDGLWNSSCGRNCSDKCTVCHQDSGYCLTCSSTGVFGTKCDVPCSNTCMNSSCLINGSCKSGCISDYFGPSCEQSCPTNCARSGHGTRCSHATGICLYGCNEGFKGDDCLEALKLDNSIETGSAAEIEGGVAAVVVVALVVVVGLLMFFRRRNRTLLYDNVVRDANADRTEHTYDGIYMNVSAESAKECSTTVVSTDYQNTSDRLSESPEQTSNEEHTYSIGL